MSHSMYHALLLVLMTSQSVVSGHGSDYTAECEGNECCAAMSKSVMDQMNKQAANLEQMMKAALNKSMDVILTQLNKHSGDLLLHDDHLKIHDSSQSKDQQLIQSIYGAELGPRDCNDIRAMGYNTSGVYRVYPGSDIRRVETDVYCDFRDPKASWLVFQRRKDGSENFDRTWGEYERGFGALDGEFWLGNEKLSLLTMNKKYKLRVDMEDFEKEKRYAEYSTFSVKPSTDKYRLTVAGYSGNAGESLIYSNSRMFTAKDSDNDPATYNCAQQYHGGWWYNTCHHANLNALYLGGSHSQIYQGVCWFGWKGHYYSLKATEMKITAVL